MPRLVHLTTTDISLALLLGSQLTAFIRAGFEVIGMSAAGPHVAALEEMGVTHMPVVNATRSMSLGRDLKALGELRSALRDLRPDILHTHNPKPGLYGRLAGRAAGVPIVVNTVHGIYALPTDPLLKRAVFYGLERLASTCSHAELVQNPDDLELLARLGVPRRKLHQLGNGIDLERFDRHRVADERVSSARQALGAGPSTVVCGAVGRLVWEKGYKELFEAARRLRGGQPDLVFVVIGPSDPEKTDCIDEESLRRAEQEGGVRFLHYREDMEVLYAAMDIFALASYREGFSRSGMEAAAMGVPVVVTDVRGCRNVVDDCVTGVLVPPRDAGALTDAISRLALDADLRASMGRAGRQKALREFDQDRVIQITLDVYRELLERRSRPLAA